MRLHIGRKSLAQNTFCTYNKMRAADFCKSQKFLACPSSSVCAILIMNIRNIIIGKKLSDMSDVID